jgi:hypothetical protein
MGWIDGVSFTLRSLHQALWVGTPTNAHTSP